VGLLLSAAFHLVAVGVLVWLAAREGLLGIPLKKITVNLVREPAPVEPPPTEKSKPVPAEMSSPSFSEPIAPRVSSPSPAPPPVASPIAPPEQPVGIAAPPPVVMPSFAFEEGGKTVQTGADPAARYRRFVEFSLRSRWNRPIDTPDHDYVAEIEIEVSPNGRINDPRWIRKSGDARWDASAWEAVAQTHNLDRSPPPGFPSRVTLRFDVVPSEEMVHE
jgi:hypothetical protein